MRNLSIAHASTAVMLCALTLLVVVNLGHPVHASAVAQLGSCSLDSIRGGVDWVGAIDGGCAISGVGALFLEASSDRVRQRARFRRVSSEYYRLR